MLGLGKYSSFALAWEVAFVYKRTQHNKSIAETSETGLYYVKLCFNKITCLCLCLCMGDSWDCFPRSLLRTRFIYIRRVWFNIHVNRYTFSLSLHCSYIAGRFKIISNAETKGLATFVGTFALPSLIFLSLVELNWNKVNWTFLLAMLISKAFVFFAVLVICLLVTRPLNYSRAGLMAIFCTQSNDFAIGYPIGMRRDLRYSYN